jgi:hypothetical protein
LGGLWDESSISGSREGSKEGSVTGKESGKWRLRGLQDMSMAVAMGMVDTVGSGRMDLTNGVVGVCSGSAEIRGTDGCICFWKDKGGENGGSEAFMEFAMK